MNRWLVFSGAVTALLVISIPAQAQIPYYYSPTKGMAPGPSQGKSSNRTSSGSSSSRSITAVAPGVVGGEILPFLSQNDTLSELGSIPIAQPPDEQAHIWLRIPAGARVRFNGESTDQTGELRHYVSPSLIPGQSYHYNVQIRWKKNGKPIEVDRTVYVRAGAAVELDLIRIEGAENSSVSRTAK
jgi:uncharacterized protein (TIGR03000 family)